MSPSRTFVRPLVVCAAVGLGTLAASRTVHAQDLPAPASVAQAITPAVTWTPPDLGAALRSVDEQTSGRDGDDAIRRTPLPAKRPRPLAPLYVSFVALQALDIHSTFVSLENGGREANPIVSSMLGSGPTLPIVKAASAGAIIYLTERIWKRNRTAAIVTMIALNSAYAGIVAHNYAVGRR